MVGTPVYDMHTNQCLAVAQLRHHVSQPLWVKMDPVREMYQMGIGAHPDQSASVFGSTSFY